MPIAAIARCLLLCYSESLARMVSECKLIVRVSHIYGSSEHWIGHKDYLYLISIPVQYEKLSFIFSYRNIPVIFHFLLLPPNFSISLSLSRSFACIFSALCHRCLIAFVAPFLASFEWMALNSVSNCLTNTKQCSKQINFPRTVFLFPKPLFYRKIIEKKNRKFSLPSKPQSAINLEG